MTGPGWVFWGLFVACAAVVAGYVLWMLSVERKEDE